MIEETAAEPLRNPVPAGGFQPDVLRACLALALTGAGLPLRRVDSLGGVSEIPPKEILHAALWHHVAGELHEGAKQRRLPEIEDLTAATAARIRKDNMRSLSVLSGVGQTLAGAGVQMLVLKGPATAALSRRHPLLRRSIDLDIVVKPEDVIAAHAVLTGLGAVRDSRFPEPQPGRVFSWYLAKNQEIGYRLNEVRIDLHWQLGYARSLLPRAWEALDRSRGLVSGGITFRGLDPADAVVHSAAHWRYEEYRRFKYVIDTLGLASAGDHVAPAAKVLVARARGVAEALAYADGHQPLQEPPAGFSSRQWARIVAVQSASREPPRSRGAARWATLGRHLRTSTEWRDRVDVPERSIAGPVTRVWQRAARSSRQQPESPSTAPHAHEGAGT